MDQLELAKSALRGELKRLAADQAHLEAVLAKLEAGSGHVPTVLETAVASAKSVVAAVTGSGKKRGRPAKAKAEKPATAGSGDGLSAASTFIKEAGRAGIKALALSHRLKKDGITPPSKVELLEAGFKTKGKGGGTTYHA